MALLGFPTDRGVQINGGRPGAAAGPDAIREVLYRLTPDSRHNQSFGDLLSRTTDLGNVEVTANLEEDLERLGSIVTALIDAGTIPIILGGGHETAYGHCLGYISKKKVSIVNFDAHLDVREKVQGLNHSGSSFRSALENDQLDVTYTAAGLQRCSNATSHVAYANEQGVELHWMGEGKVGAYKALVTGAASAGPIMVSFDLDVVDCAYAPGVSAKSVGGLGSREFLELAFEAGRSPAVSSVDICELNPQYDVDGRTAKLAAVAVWNILSGISERVA